MMVSVQQFSTEGGCLLTDLRVGLSGVSSPMSPPGRTSQCPQTWQTRFPGYTRIEEQATIKEDLKNTSNFFAVNGCCLSQLANQNIAGFGGGSTFSCSKEE